MTTERTKLPPMDNRFQLETSGISGSRTSQAAKYAKATIDCRERQLHDALARAEKADAELATAKSDLDMEVARLLKAQDLQIEATTEARNEAASESLWRKQAERERGALKSELAEIRAGRRHILTSSIGEQAPCGGPGLCKWCDAAGGEQEWNLRKYKAR